MSADAASEKIPFNTLEVCVQSLERSLDSATHLRKAQPISSEVNKEFCLVPSKNPIKTRRKKCGNGVTTFLGR
jgi:hypothetical protein